MDHNVPYDELDPGIRRIVRALNAEGLTTTDSGDGVSKADPCCGMNAFPHVALRVALDDMRDAFDRVQHVLDTLGLAWAPVPTLEEAEAATVPEGVEWQTHWDPRFDADHVHVLLSGWSLSTPPRDHTAPIV